jgi:hypothetical protein
MDVSGGEFTYGSLEEGFTPNVVVGVFRGQRDTGRRGRRLVGRSLYGEHSPGWLAQACR